MYITIDIGGTNIRVLSFTSFDRGSEGEFISFATPQNFEEGYTQIKNAIFKIKGDVSISGISISHAGEISREEKIALDISNLPDYIGKPLVKNLERDFFCPVIISNDSVCGSFGEYMYGEYKSENRFGYITVSTGIGASFIESFGDKYHILGTELGHTMVVGQKQRCFCGRIDCIEMYTSGIAISSRFLKKAENMNDLRIWERAVEYLALAATNFIVMFAPKVVVFGGGMIESNVYIQQKLEYEIKNQLFEKPMPIIALSQLQEKNALYGALALLQVKPQNLI